MKRFLTALTFLMSCLAIPAQNMVTAKGQVLDNDGQPLLGCTIHVKGTKLATVTDQDGKFTIQVPQGSSMTFSYIGFLPQTAKASDKIKVELQEDAHTLNEVLAVGYGKMKRSDMTGAVVSVKGDDMQQTSAATMDQMLQGRAAGIQVVGNSGAAGASNSVQIRGINSLSSTNEPIYVIDGVIVRSEVGSDVYSNPLTDLNPNDVESVEILKDASATAIYGSQAANGVIIVNMKKGKEGEPNVNFKASVGYDQLTRKLNVMNLPQMASWINDLRTISGQSLSDYFASPSTLDNGQDWQEALYRTGLRQEYNLSVRGGSKAITYNVSGGYFSQDGIIISNSFSRYNLRATIDAKPYKWLDLGATANITHSFTDTGMASWNIVSNALSQTPNVPVKLADGSWGKSGYNNETSSYQPNPVAIASVTTRNNKMNSTRANVYFTLKPWKWLQWINEGSYDSNTNTYLYFLPAYDFGGTVCDYATHQQSTTTNYYLDFQSEATGHWKIGKHDLTALAGYEMNSRKVDFIYAQRLGGSDTNPYVSGGDATRDTENGYSTDVHYTSYFGRLSYNYAGRYMLTTTLRRDGSSLFEKGKRWGTFPSAAFAWNLSKEKFFQPFTNIVSNMKLRLGYGLVGNANLADNTYQPTFTTLESNFGVALKTANMPNYAGLTWEKTHSWNVGIDLSFLDNRIEVIFDAFDKKVKDLLMQTSLPYYTGTIITGGTTAQWANVGSMTNKGFELTINAFPISGRKFTWETSFTGSAIKNNITALNTENGYIDKKLDSDWSGSETVTRTAVGHSVSEFYGYHVLGRINSASDFLRDNGDGTSTVIAATPNYRVGTVVRNSSVTAMKTSIGDILFKDVNGDGFIDTKDMDYLGSPLPKVTFGWNSTFTWKSFAGVNGSSLALSVFVYGSVGGKVFNWVRRKMDEPSFVAGSASNKFTRVCSYAKYAYVDGNSGNENVWNVYVTPGADDSETRIDNSNSNYNSRVSDRYVEDASYLRMKNITLSYTFGRNLVRKLRMQQIRFSANIQNLCTLTGYNGYDPEVGSQNAQYSMSGQSMLLYGVDTGKVPTPRTVIFTLDVTF